MTVRTTGEPVPVVLVGARGYGHSHRKNLERLTAAGQTRVVGICDPYPLDAAELDGLGRPPQSTDLAALLERTRPVVTVVSTPPHTHVPLALTAVRAGSHVLLEKPPAPSLTAFRELTDALRHAGRVCQVGFQSLGSHALDTVRRLVADGAVGRPLGLGCAGAWVRDARYYARAEWAGRRRLGAGPDSLDVVDGVLTNPLAHALATALRLDGGGREGDVASVELELFRAYDIEADDTSCVRLKTARGTTVTLAATLCAERNTVPYVVVHGEHGTITLDYLSDRVLVAYPGREPEWHAYGRTDLLEDLLAHLRFGTELRSPLEGSGAFTRVVDSIRTAADPVRLPEQAWYTDDTGAAPRRVIPGVTELIDASAARLSLFSELGAPWAARVASTAPTEPSVPEPRTEGKPPC